MSWRCSTVTMSLSRASGCSALTCNYKLASAAALALSNDPLRTNINWWCHYVMPLYRYVMTLWATSTKCHTTPWLQLRCTHIWCTQDELTVWFMHTLHTLKTNIENFSNADELNLQKNKKNKRQVVLPWSIDHDHQPCVWRTWRHSCVVRRGIDPKGQDSRSKMGPVT